MTTIHTRKLLLRPPLKDMLKASSCSYHLNCLAVLGSWRTDLCGYNLGSRVSYQMAVTITMGPQPPKVDGSAMLMKDKLRLLGFYSMWETGKDTGNMALPQFHLLDLPQVSFVELNLQPESWLLVNLENRMEVGWDRPSIEYRAFGHVAFSGERFLPIIYSSKPYYLYFGWESLSVSQRR